jgi:dienelactone hydrolase
MQIVGLGRWFFATGMIGLGMVFQAVLVMGPIPAATAQPAESHCFRNNASSAGALVETAAVHIRGVPAIVRSPSRIKRPPIILWHGFGPPANARALAEALPLDAIQGDKIYLELPLFGERSLPGGTAELIARQNRDYLTQVLAPVVVGARADLTTVIGELRRRGCLANNGRVTLIGFSAGGLAALSAMTSAQASRDIQSVVALDAPTSAETAVRLYELASGRPYSWSVASDSAAHSLDISALLRQQSRPATLLPSVFLLQGAEDAAPLVEGAREFKRTIKPLYRAERDPSDFEVRILPNIGHAWSTGAQRSMVEAVVTEWLERH